ncbi:MAG: MFS transporter [Chloroflexi bacterium]|nr:MFS transporter [Chloroflexota bacterium]
MESYSPRGYASVLRNRHFLALWMAQILSNTALNGSFFLQVILIEEITGSSAQLSAVTIAFSLPAILLSALAGLVVDRVSKKYILLASNALRILTGALLALLASVLLTSRLSETAFLVEIYILVFLTSAIGQFFAPAEGATIPLLVRSDNLLPANSLFTITFTASQILGLIILAPLAVKLLGISGALWGATAMYVAATILVALIPRDRTLRTASMDGVSALRRAWHEIHEGWHFAITHRMILIALFQLALVSALTMMMVVLAPGYATRVLGLSAEDATYVFWPAGLGMLLASIAIGRYGHRVPRPILSSIGIFGMGLALAGLAWAGGGGGPFDRPLFRAYPELVISTTASIMAFALLTGMAMALMNIPAQTVVQEESNDTVRGRVLAVQFTLGNAVGIVPILFIGNLADIYGIPRVTLVIAIFIIALAVLNLFWSGSPKRLAPSSRSELPADSSHSPRP